MLRSTLSVDFPHCVNSSFGELWRQTNITERLAIVLPVDQAPLEKTPDGAGGLGLGVGSMSQDPRIGNDWVRVLSQRIWSKDTKVGGHFRFEQRLHAGAPGRIDIVPRPV